jgi:hypothetical protein
MQSADGIWFKKFVLERQTVATAGKPVDRRCALALGCASTAYSQALLGHHHSNRNAFGSTVLFQCHLCALQVR